MEKTAQHFFWNIHVDCSTTGLCWSCSGSQLGKGGDCQGAVLGVINWFSIIFVELVMQNVTEHFLESAKGSRILMAHIHVKRSPGARYYHPEGDFPFCWGGGEGSFSKSWLVWGGHVQIRVTWWVSLIFMKVERGGDGRELKLNVTSVNSKHQSYLHDCRDSMWSTSESSLACRTFNMFSCFSGERFFEKSSVSHEKCQKLTPVLQTTWFFVRILIL